MRRQQVVFCLSVILLLSFGSSLALENNIGGSGRIAGMGFSQVANDGFFGNPAYCREGRIVVNTANSELFGTGVIYNYLETGIRLAKNLQLNFGLESVADQDTFDNSGYGQRLMALGVAIKPHSAWQVGISFAQNQYRLVDERTGSGYALNFGMRYGPLQFGKSNLSIGVKIDDLLAHRAYKSGRNETPQSMISLGVQLKTETLIYAVDLFDKSFRFGFEYQIIPFLALRAGWNNGEVTLGIGVSKGPLKVDYAYWISEAGPTHRLGTGISF